MYRLLLSPFLPFVSLVGPAGFNAFAGPPHPPPSGRFYHFKLILPFSDFAILADLPAQTSITNMDRKTRLNRLTRLDGRYPVALVSLVWIVLVLIH